MYSNELSSIYEQIFIVLVKSFIMLRSNCLKESFERLSQISRCLIAP